MTRALARRRRSQSFLSRILTMQLIRLKTNQAAVFGHIARRKRRVRGAPAVNGGLYFSSRGIGKDVKRGGFLSPFASLPGCRFTRVGWLKLIGKRIPTSPRRSKAKFSKY